MPEWTDRRALLRIGGAALGAAAATATLGAAPAAAADPEDVITPQQFGALADGQHDDTDAIEQAINATLTKTTRIVVFPPGTYRITRTIVIPDVSGESFNRIQLRGYSTMTNRASIIQVTHDGVGIDVRCSLAAIHGLAFVAPAKTEHNVALRFAGEVNTDDTDAAILECTFVSFKLAVDHVGRGLYFSHNLVALCTTGISLAWPTGNVDGGGVHLPPYGLRKWLITNNHFHSPFQAIVAQGAESSDFRGMIIQGNLLDIGRRLFIGSISNSTISGNVVENADNGAIIEITSGGHNLTIGDNVLGGFEAPQDKGTRAIQFSSGVKAHNVTISGNTFNWLKGTPIRFENDAARITIANNSFGHWNLSGRSDNAAISVAGKASAFSIIGNVISADPANRPPIMTTGGLHGSHVIGNASEQVPLVAGPVGADSFVQAAPGRFNRMEVAGPLGAAAKVVSTSTEPVKVGTDRYGSFVVEGSNANPGVKGGVRVVPVNQSGSAATELLCSTTSTNELVSMAANATGLVPPADNARDLGSATQRMRTVYAHQVVLAEHTPGSLPDAAGQVGGIILVRDPKTGKRGLALSDGAAWRNVVLGPQV
ncbi:glycosyl hydrolase family 28-related protein [Nonomuraea sp. NPDC049419]|uniref:glycosyl hydrolase family 28-related protein n=1 Tax=Nonomuraea sp. NPDC049419 TaxID=3155772 RepID=UPI0034443D7C